MEYDDAACVSAIDVSRSAKCAEAKVHPAWTSVVVGAAGNALQSLRLWIVQDFK